MGRARCAATTSVVVLALVWGMVPTDGFFTLLFPWTVTAQCYGRVLLVGLTFFRTNELNQHARRDW